MGKFVNKTYTNTINDLVESQIKKFDNANYVFIDKAPYIVDFYNPNNATSLSEGSRLSFESIGPNSPIRYSYIKDALVYISGAKFEFNLEPGEFGTEASSIDGEAYILPNTFKPFPGAFFTFNHASKEYLFIVTGVDVDTVDNGNNFYKMQYSLYYIGKETLDKLKKQVTERYHMVSDNIGTEFKSVIRQNDYDLISKVEPLLSDLRTFYRSLFYKKPVQTFVFYSEENKYFYDPYCIEFMIRTGIMNDSEQYEYITQAMYLPDSFPIDYDRSFWRCFETGNYEKLPTNNAFGRYIEDPNSLFVTRLEDYYWAIYIPDLWFNCWQPLPHEVIGNIQNRLYYPEDDEKYIYNILTDFFRNPESIISTENIKAIDNLDMVPSRELFYLIPLIIYCMESAIKRLIVNI